MRRKNVVRVFIDTVAVSGTEHDDARGLAREFCANLGERFATGGLPASLSRNARVLRAALPASTKLGGQALAAALSNARAPGRKA